MFNKSNLNRFFFIMPLIAFTIFMTNCGKRQLPTAPIANAPQEVSAEWLQRGNNIIITWELPPLKSAGKNVFNIKKVNIYRLAEAANTSLTLSENEFVTRSVLISTIPIKDEDFIRKQITFTDSLQFVSQKIRLRYSIRFVNDIGQQTALSSFLLIEPTEQVALEPTNLSAKVFEKNILLSWNAPNRNVDDSKPANVVGYNVYRIENDNTKLLNSLALQDNNFTDNFFEFGKEYKYFIRTISLGRKGSSIESSSSNIIEISPKDIFAPSPPTAITVASAPGSLSIFFAANPENDILGYKIYRSTDVRQPKFEWKLLTPEPLKRNNFQDFAITPGQTYYYYLIAIDSSGNTSEPSEVIFDTAP